MSNEQGPKPVIHTKKHVARLERERQQTRLILYLFGGLLTAVILLLVYGYVDVNYLQLNKPVATVGDAEISARDFESRVRIQRAQLLDNYQQYVQFQQFMDVSQQLQELEYYLGNAGVIGQGVLNQMINEEVVRQEAAKMGITVSAEELEEAIQADFGYYPNGTLTPTITATLPPTTAATETPLATATLAATLTPEGTTIPPVDATNETLVPTATLEPTLTATATLVPTLTPTSGPTSTATPTSTPYTFEGYEKQYATVVAGFDKFDMNEEGYRKFIEIRLLQEKIKDAVVAEVADDTQQEVHARHILVGDEALAVTIIDRLKAGEDFAELAKEYSTDTGSGVNGGDLGWFGPGDMVAEFETAAFALENPDDFTQTPVQSEFGYHIIQLIEKRERPMTADEASTARDAKYEEWLAAARETYTVVINEEFWRLREPQDPNFVTLATEVAETSVAIQTEQAESTATSTSTPE